MLWPELFAFAHEEAEGLQLGSKTGKKGIQLFILSHDLDHSKSNNIHLHSSRHGRFLMRRNA